MKIPKRFKLLGHTYEVKEVAGDYFHNKRYGGSSFEGKWISIVPMSENHPVTQSSIEHTFCHELVHQMLYYTEHQDLNNNEGFVDMLSGLLHQALMTFEYEDEDEKP